MSEDPSGNPTDLTPPAIDPIATLLAEIKDESGRQKYADPETAIKALKASQEYIPALKTELDALKERAKLQSDMKTVEELLMPDATPAPTPAVPAPVEPTTPPADPSAVAQPSIEDQMQAFLDKQAVEKTKQDNLGSVKDTLSTKFGDKKDEVYAAKAEELGVDAEFLDSMAARSPAAVLAYFAVKAPSATPTSTLNITGMQPTPAEIPSVMHGATSQQVKDTWAAYHPNNIRG